MSELRVLVYSSYLKQIREVLIRGVASWCLGLEVIFAI